MFVLSSREGRLCSLEQVNGPWLCDGVPPWDQVVCLYSDFRCTLYDSDVF